MQDWSIKGLKWSVLVLQSDTAATWMRDPTVDGLGVRDEMTVFAFSTHPQTHMHSFRTALKLYVREPKIPLKPFDFLEVWPTPTSRVKSRNVCQTGLNILASLDLVSAVKVMLFWSGLNGYSRCEISSRFVGGLFDGTAHFTLPSCFYTPSLTNKYTLVKQQLWMQLLLLSWKQQRCRLIFWH